MTQTAPILSLIYPFYANPTMLREQYRIWAGYPEELKELIEVVIVDDGTPYPEAAVNVERPAGLPSLRIFRVLEDLPWHQHGARNLGAHAAAGGWLFLSDMDHVLPSPSLAALVPKLNYEVVYTFRRLDAPTFAPTTKNGRAHPHPNTFAMTRCRYWEVGGYDEDCTGYGTDSFFRARLFADRQPVHLLDVPIVRYPRELVFDASTRTLPRKDGRPIGHRQRLRALVAQKAREGRKPTTLAFQWTRVL